MNERVRNVGMLLIGLGLSLPVLGFLVYSSLCFESCDLGGPGTCFLQRVTCDLDPWTAALLAWIPAVMLVAAGLIARSTLWPPHRQRRDPTSDRP